MSTVKEKRIKRARRHKRVRAKVSGCSTRPRISVFRSNKHIWIQMIDDKRGHTIISASDLELKLKDKTRTERAKMVGELAAKKAREKNIASAVFDRGGYKFHGIVKAVAEGIRQGGIKF